MYIYRHLLAFGIYKNQQIPMECKVNICQILRQIGFNWVKKKSHSKLVKSENFLLTDWKHQENHVFGFDGKEARIDSCFTINLDYFPI